MNTQPTQPGPGRGNEAPWRAARPVAAAAVARRQGRSRLRAATVAVGAAGLAVTGGVAYALPGSSHASTTGSGGSTGSAAASQNTGSSAGTSTGSSGSASSSGSAATGGSGFSGSSGISATQGGQTTSGGS
jgi:type IV secretion system protein TrbL